MSGRQRTWAERAITDGSKRPVGDSARRRRRQVASTRPRLIEAQARHDERLAVEEANVADAERSLAAATRRLLAQVPWATQVVELTGRDFGLGDCSQGDLGHGNRPDGLGSRRGLE